MKPSAALNTHREAIRRMVEAHRARNPRVFGSVLDGTDTEASDLDLLIDPAPGMTLFDIGGIIEDLQDVLGVKVDVLPVRSSTAVVRVAPIARIVTRIWP